MVHTEKYTTTKVHLKYNLHLYTLKMEAGQLFVKKISRLHFAMKIWNPMPMNFEHNFDNIKW